MELALPKRRDIDVNSVNLPHFNYRALAIWSLNALYATLSLSHNQYFGIWFKSITPPRLFMISAIIGSALYRLSQSNQTALNAQPSGNKLKLVQLGLLGIVVSLVIASTASLNPYQTFKESLFWTGICLIYGAACFLRLDGSLHDKDLRKMCLAFVLSYPISLFAGIVITLFSDAITDRWSFLHAIGRYTVDGLINNRDVGAPLIALSIPILVALTVHPNMGRWARVAAAVTLVFLSYLLPFYEKRTGLIAIICALVVQAMMWLTKRQAWKTVMGWLLVIGSIAAAHGTMIFLGMENRWISLYDPSTKASTGGRLAVFKGDLWIARNYPMGVGAGPDNFIPIFMRSPYFQELTQRDPLAAYSPGLNPHSLVLGVATAGGWTGLFFYVLLLSGVLWMLNRAGTCAKEWCLIPAFMIFVVTFGIISCFSFVHSEWPWGIILLGILYSLPDRVDGQRCRSHAEASAQVAGEVADGGKVTR